MSQAGIGVMLHALSGYGNTGANLSAAIGKIIASVTFDSANDSIAMRFTDGTGITFRDEGQSCCEYRYMRTDADLGAHVGATLLGAEIRNGDYVEDEYGDVHEVQFLNINTSKGVIDAVCHNEHNGYYGGFDLSVSPLK